ncbi:uncharacterized protein LOC122389655 [Amphibalanus amphitrite]|uniref:uncharacterized protein LOC122380858 n=1 Tax=Amphibalanus amphitrite TaxID=1232801 RepID=UPI001C9011B5|nr:uncharacterized protein LOC122380858 [Amphibalanus amphitrite]XP_043237804.1 uncharacterized protein LOC122389655 [Amphibalanus amphitrite]
MDNLRVSELREQLRQRGLSQRGTKKTLLHRLRTAMAEADTDDDSTKPRSTNSLQYSTNSIRKADRSTESLSSSVHSAQSGSCISESLFIKQANEAAKRAGLEARMMLLAEKQRLTEETRLARQRELELELQQEKLDLQMQILDSAAREKEFEKFQVHLENSTAVNPSITKQEAQREIRPTLFRENKATAASMSEDCVGVEGMVSRGQNTDVEGRYCLTATKTESPAHKQTSFCSEATAQAYDLTTVPPDLFTQMLGLTERSTIPRVEIEKFDGEVAYYRSFIRAFEHLICNKVQSDDEKLYYLEQYTTGQPREVVRGCLHMPEDKGYKEARRLLEARYGNQYKIAARSVDRILNWPAIKVDEIDAMDDFSIALRTCYNSMAGMVTETSELDHPKTIRKILEKFPPTIQDRWRRLAEDVREHKNRIVTFKDLVDFVEREARIATNPLFGRHLFPATRGKPEGQRSGPANRYSLAAHIGPANHGGQPVPCLWCKAMHPLDECAHFVQNPMEVKREFIRNNSLCFGCLVQGHVAKSCTNRSVCRECKGKHATALHSPPGEVQSTRRTTTYEAIKNARVDINNEASLASCGMAIVPVKVRTRTGHCVETYAFLDNGSSASFCTESLCKRLHVSDTKPITLKLTTVHSHKKTLLSKRIDGLMLSDLDENEHIPLPSIFTLSYIPVSEDDIPTYHDISKFPYLSDIDMPRINAGIELMIGNNVPQAMEPWEVRHSQMNGPYAIRTKLGWVINGPVRDLRANVIHANGTRAAAFHHGLDETLQNMYEQEFPEKNFSVAKGMSHEDRRWMAMVQESCRVSADGHYEIALPFCQANPELPNNLELAIRRLEGLKRKLMKDNRLREHYTATMTDMLSKGYIERAPELDSMTKGGKKWYLPHHGVYHPQKPHKVRIVFDAAASYKGTSLNDALLQGPDLTNSLIDVLLRFRWAPVCFTADIEAMFHQVRVPDRDRDFLRFLWWTGGDLTDQPAEYRFTVHPFGATSSPACANYALRRAATDHGSHFSADTVETILYNFYVDDCLKSVETGDDGIRIGQELIELCSRGGFNLTKFVSNCSALSPHLDNDKSNCCIEFDQERGLARKALGVKWSLDTDSFSFSAAIKERPMSKRGILAIVGSVYDPFGLISPYVLIARHLLRDLCRIKVGWDECIPKPYQKQWEQWLNDLLVLNNISVPRCLRPRSFRNAFCQLHHFSDGSERAYGTVSYFRVVNEAGDIHCGFVFGRSRLAPLKGTTIPRIELAAATLAVKVNAMIQSAFQTKIESWFWTDSTTVLRYIRNEKTRFHTFVANRLAVIREGSSPNQWKYVQSSLNPADIASRGASGKDISKNQEWFSGPEFLWKESHEWPLTPNNLGDITEDIEVKRERKKEQLPNTDLRANCTNVITVLDVHPVETLLSYYSSRWKVVRAIAWLLRVRHRLLCKEAPRATRRNLSIEEMEAGEREIVIHEQMASYASERKHLAAGRPVQLSSSLQKLNPILQDGFVVVGGRLERALLPETAKHPIILPASSRYATMVIQDVHEQLGHQGLSHVLTTVRQKFWIIHGNKAVRKVLSNCLHCRRRFSQPENQKMADLPIDRVQALQPPFTSTGVDCFGPFFVKRGRGQEKRYGIIFTCLAIRAVHLEMADNLSTDSFICALKRFISRRGNVQVIRSDNGTNFVGTNNELKREWRKLHSSDAIYNTLAKRGIEWIFNTPGASHHGGVWERMIRSTRRVLESLLSSQLLTDETLRTFLCEAESIINSRPLTPLTMDPTDAEPLTPNHLLLLAPGGDLQAGIWQETDNISIRRWKQARYMTELFWKRWRTEYLPLLQSRPRAWTRSRGNLKEGDVVLLVDTAVPRGQWPIGRVQTVKTSLDGLVRSVTILCRGTQLTRPIQKLVKLLSEDETS